MSRRKKPVNRMRPPNGLYVNRDKLFSEWLCLHVGPVPEYQKKIMKVLIGVDLAKGRDETVVSSDLGMAVNCLAADDVKKFTRLGKS